MNIRIQDIDLKLLRMFATIVKHGGFSAAQYELNLSLSAISAAMSQLESRLGFKLCERGRKGFHLTEGGRIVHREVNLLLRSLETFQNSVDAFKGHMHGHISIAMDDAILTNRRCPLYKVFRHFSEQAPNLRLDIRIMTPSEMEKALLENDLNVAIGPFREISPSLESTVIFEETQLLCCGQTHPAFGEKDPKAIENHIHHSYYAARSYDDRTAALAQQHYSGAVATTDMEAMLAMILSGRYMGYLARHVAEHWISLNEIWALAPEVYSYKEPISIVYPRAHDDPRIKLFMDSANEVLRREAEA